MNKKKDKATAMITDELRWLKQSVEEVENALQLCDVGALPEDAARWISDHLRSARKLLESAARIEHAQVRYRWVVIAPHGLDERGNPIWIENADGVGFAESGWAETKEAAVEVVNQKLRELNPDALFIWAGDDRVQYIDPRYWRKGTEDNGWVQGVAFLANELLVNS